MDREQDLGLGDGTPGSSRTSHRLDALSKGSSHAQSWRGAHAWTISISAAVSRQLGDEAAVDARTLSNSKLRDSSTMKRGSDGQLGNGQKAMRQLSKAFAIVGGMS
jgi:uncharacterized protein with von Willebrand factor type A (vWA) domain